MKIAATSSETQEHPRSADLDDREQDETSDLGVGTELKNLSVLINDLQTGFGHFTFLRLLFFGHWVQNSQ